MYRDVSASELVGWLGTELAPFVLDVRERDEFASWSIPGAVNIPLADLMDRAGELPPDREILAVCATGNRSTVAADALGRAGWHAANLLGGMTAWGSVYDSVTLDVGAVQVVQVRRRGKGCLSYVVGARTTAYVVDPSMDIDVYREIAAEHDWHIAGVLDTHLHADHLSGARALADATGARLHLSPDDAFHFPFEPIEDGETLPLPADCHQAITARRAPGHTRGSTVYRVGDHVLLTGDTLFVDGVGRPDLADRAEEFAHDLFRTLHEVVLPLPDDVRVFPAHFGEHVAVRPTEPVTATLGELRSTLAPLGYGEDEFVAWVTDRTTPRPPNFTEIVSTNTRGVEHAGAALRQLELGPNRCSAT